MGTWLLDYVLIILMYLKNLYSSSLSLIKNASQHVSNDKFLCTINTIVNITHEIKLQSSLPHKFSNNYSYKISHVNLGLCLKLCRASWESE